MGRLGTKIREFGLEGLEAEGLTNGLGFHPFPLEAGTGAAGAAGAAEGGGAGGGRELELEFVSHF